jgi:EAL domain-containing protein (putative c-di-GMP-specific phosphodiesterase class I)/ActR/RegA family two-component response regulator
MASYKVFDQPKFQQSRVYTFWFRRYAPFDDFGGDTGFRFEGDHRASGSTSPKATSRTYGCLFFTTSEIIYGFSGSSGTTWEGYAPWTSAVPGIRILGEILNKDAKGATAFAKVSLDVAENVQPSVIEFTAATAGGMPLLPGTPDIDTFVKMNFDFTQKGVLAIKGHATGDDFPNLEMFLVTPSGRSALLVDAYQPKVELATGKIVGAEALLRWEHAVYGTQPTGRFIPIAEESGLIVDIGAWALRHVARFAVRVNRGRPNPLAFSVNLSQLQFRRDDVAQLLRTILEQTDAEPSWLMLELTESLLADNSPAMIGTLRELRAMGVGLSVDDFGTGYSSLSRLEAFPISEFKIDRSFVSQVDQNRSKHVIVDAMIRLGKELQISVVAEGAETKDEVSVLRKLGCPYAQGYFFGRPMPEAKFVPLLDGKVLSFDQNDVVHRPSAGRSQSAVVVDDDPLFLAMLSETLEHLGWMVTTASSAEEVLALPESFPAPQIVITDVNLGTGMDGFEFCPVARRRWPDVKIVVISGRQPNSEQLDTLSLHDVFLPKPVDMSALEAAIASRWADRID